ncbi:hypothetical protein H6F74_26610 [Trichocoleus sp. FACHB-90]|uniref:hypothetical protein n=1 Tax=Cyanophyceae TaxID=3028117 RepID=UPI001686D748|nr:hypothetical protein [Trichocoleus sp. FACHB-90]MBD1929778.1 hypothetical protein [Trichocoleus sp. FACHB-90]
MTTGDRAFEAAPIDRSTPPFQRRSWVDQSFIVFKGLKPFPDKGFRRIRSKSPFVVGDRSTTSL